MTTNKTNKQFLIGEVVSASMDKTVVVQVLYTRQHPLLNKITRSYKKYKVHDENGSASIGDKVEFFEGRPKSKTKYMYLHRIVEKNSDVQR